MTVFEAYTPATWTRRGLENARYEGFVTFADLRALGATTRPGVYVVLRPGAEEPVFSPANAAGKRKDFTEDIDVLGKAWVPGAEVIYIGLARLGSRRDGIHRRLKQFRRTGAGTADTHGGGVWIFQLADAEDLLVCWRGTDDESDAFVESLEHHLIADFVARPEHGKWPFANRKD